MFVFLHTEEHIVQIQNNISHETLDEVQDLAGYLHRLTQMGFGTQIKYSLLLRKYNHLKYYQILN